MSDYETILCEMDGSLATVTLNRPDSLNGITGLSTANCMPVCARWR